MFNNHSDNEKGRALRVDIQVSGRCLLAALLAVFSSLSLAADSREIHLDQHPWLEPIWALNVGGSHYQSVHGVTFQADDCEVAEVCRRLEAVTGTQQEPVYLSYREGVQSYRFRVAEGAYALTLYFAETKNTPDRTFQIRFNGVVYDNQFNIPRFRDGLTDAALARTWANIEPVDGVIQLDLESGSALPILSGIALERRTGEQLGRLRWADEFSGTGLDSRYWTIDEWPARKVNDEDQAYVASPATVRVDEGRLVLEAHQVNEPDAIYHSGRVHSLGKIDFRYGRLDVRARVPKGQGVWPAIWLLPTHPYRYASSCDARNPDWQGASDCDAWPNSGEIDLMEHVGFEPGIVHGTVHTRGYYWVQGNQRKGSVVLNNLGDTFHVYSLRWRPDRLDMFVDDNRYFTYSREQSDWRQWPFDHAFHIVMNLAVGGQWGRAGGPIDPSIFPQSLEIDYVRVYEVAPVPSEATNEKGK